MTEIRHLLGLSGNPALSTIICLSEVLAKMVFPSLRCVREAAVESASSDLLRSGCRSWPVRGLVAVRRASPKKNGDPVSRIVACRFQLCDFAQFPKR